MQNTITAARARAARADRADRAARAARAARDRAVNDLASPLSWGPLNVDSYVTTLTRFAESLSQDVNRLDEEEVLEQLECNHSRMRALTAITSSEKVLTAALRLLADPDTQHGAALLFTAGLHLFPVSDPEAHSAMLAGAAAATMLTGKPATAMMLAHIAQGLAESGAARTVAFMVLAGDHRALRTLLGG